MQSANHFLQTFPRYLGIVVCSVEAHGAPYIQAIRVRQLLAAKKALLLSSSHITHQKYLDWKLERQALHKCPILDYMRSPKLVGLAVRVSCGSTFARWIVK